MLFSVFLRISANSPLSTLPQLSALALGQNIKQALTPQPLIFLDNKDTRKTCFYPNLLTPQASTTAESVQVNSSYECLPSNKRPPIIQGNTVLTILKKFRLFSG